MASWRFSSAWSRFFDLAAPASPGFVPPPLRRPVPQNAPGVASREALEVAWLLRCLPPGVRAALVPDLLALKRARPFTGALPVADYTLPDVPGVRQPRYDSGTLKLKTLEGLCSRLHADLLLGVTALCAPEYALPRPMRNALLAMQGRRLGQVGEALAKLLHPDELLRVFQQELAALR
jgi:hypothetical protein